MIDPTQPKTILVVGYGNTLRSDDGAGQRVAEQVAAWQVPNLRVLAVHQLTHDLADTLAHADLAIFIDAAASQDEHVQAQALKPSEGDAALGHTSDPRTLLALAQALYGRYPPAWLITVPAISFDFGEELSPVTTQGIGVAVQRIRELINLPDQA